MAAPRGAQQGQGVGSPRASGFGHSVDVPLKKKNTQRALHGKHGVPTAEKTTDGKQVRVPAATREAAQSPVVGNSEQDVTMPSDQFSVLVTIAILDPGRLDWSERATHCIQQEIVPRFPPSVPSRQFAPALRVVVACSCTRLKRARRALPCHRCRYLVVEPARGCHAT